MYWRYLGMGKSYKTLWFWCIYLFFIYSTWEKCFYDKYQVDVFDCLETSIAEYSAQGHVLLVGDLNSRIGNRVDYIVSDTVSKTLANILADAFVYDIDEILPQRVSEDTTVNNYGRRLIELCKMTGLRVCNGRLKTLIRLRHFYEWMDCIEERQRKSK